MLEGYVGHGLFLRKHSPYCREVPEDIFLHHVLYPRVNTEDLVDCRGFFYEQLWPLVAGKSGTEAALAVNRWCAAQMTYESTDQRTINPMTAYFCGLGRCGEESTFAVTAFRSVGIPARQIYVPWWSHCDDNHAWVEVYVEGAWRFLGACEPEPILDRGWFTSAATRAMVACSRRFFDYTGDGLAGEELIRREGCCLLYNQTRRYADTVSVTVRVEDADGCSVPGATVRFSVLNMADVLPVAELETDETGAVRLECGRGSLLLEAAADRSYAFAHLRTDQLQEMTLQLHPGDPGEGQWQLDFTAPAPGLKNRTTLTASQHRQKLEVLAWAKTERERRISGYFRSEYASSEEALTPILRLAGGNAEEIWDFYNGCDDKTQAMALLKSLAAKDYRDVKADVLRAHLTASGEPDVRCPRIGFEPLTPWRKPVLEFLTAAQQWELKEEPRKIWGWVQAHFGAEVRSYPALWVPPEVTLRLGAADARGRRLLAVAIAGLWEFPPGWTRWMAGCRSGKTGYFVPLKPRVPWGRWALQRMVRWPMGRAGPWPGGKRAGRR